MAIEQMKTMAKMQKLDDHIGSLRVLQQELPKQLSEIIERVDLATATLLAREGERNELGKKQRALESDIKQFSEQIRKYGAQLSEIKTNKEYKALNSEISYLKEKISELESLELEMMDQETEMKARVDEAKQELADAEAQKRAKEGELRAKIDSLETQIESTRAERNKLAAGLPPTLIRQYGMMIKNKNNLAVVYNRNGACGGCGFVIRPQIRIELQLRKKIILCESCGRILLEPFEEG
jgi:predicted  nucleic acid-binding Zn-ribbon protein